MDDGTIYRTILDALADPVFVKDRNHTWLYANDAFCRLMGLTRDQIVGHTDADYFEPEIYEVFYAMDDQVFLEGGVNHNEERFLGPEGVERVMSTKKTVATSERGEPVLVGIARDITAIRHAQKELLERRRAEIRAEEASQAKSRFLANMSHELRTPLNGIRGYAEMLEEEVDDPDQQHMVSQILTASQHLLAMIDQVLDLSQIESGHRRFDFEATEVHAMFLELSQALEPRATEAGSRIRITGAAATVHTDPLCLYRILSNLTVNALKYASPGEVVLDCRVDEQQARISVTDDGPGIPHEQRDKLFDKFWRANPADRTPGTGLGLAICRELTRSMGGTLEVHSEVGQGARFELTLPLADG